MTNGRIKIVRKQQQNQAIRMMAVCKRYRTTRYLKGWKSKDGL